MTSSRVFGNVPRGKKKTGTPTLNLLFNYPKLSPSAGVSTINWNKPPTVTEPLPSQSTFLLTPVHENRHSDIKKKLDRCKISLNNIWKLNHLHHLHPCWERSHIPTQGMLEDDFTKQPLEVASIPPFFAFSWHLDVVAHLAAEHGKSRITGLPFWALNHPSTGD